MKSDVLNKPYIVEDGYPFIIVPLLLAVAAGYFINAYAVVPLLLLAAYFTYFFRNPSRTMPTDDHLLVSPADGTVVGVEEVEEDAYLNQKCRKIIISCPSSMPMSTGHRCRGPLISSSIRAAASVRLIKKASAMKMNAIPSASIQPYGYPGHHHCRHPGTAHRLLGHLGR